MKRTVAAFSMIAALAAACTGDNNNGPEVSGVITNADGKTVALIGYSANRTDTIGKATLTANGKFTIPVPSDRLTFYTLQVETLKPIVLAFDSLAKIAIKADFNTLEKTYEVNGSGDSEAIRNYFIAATSYEQKLDSMMRIMQTLASEGDREGRAVVSSNYKDMQEEFRTYKINLIESDPSNAVTFSVLQSLNIREDIATFTKVRDGLGPRMQGNFFYDNLAEAVGQQERQAKLESILAPGSMAPEISLPDPSGKVVTLSSLRGKYVLIDFWASWCKPCRMENPNVVKVYEKYRNKNFEILGVSLDKDREQWVQAIETDKLRWIHVSDLQLWQSAAAQLYNVQGIPFTVLVDPDGKILETKLRAEALERRLEQIFGA